eukprot:scaffold134784_cov32-Tisochrysis_lutea.AAC.7
MKHEPGCHLKSNILPSMNSYLPARPNAVFHFCACGDVGVPNPIPITPSEPTPRNSCQARSIRTVHHAAFCDTPLASTRCIRFAALCESEIHGGIHSPCTSAATHWPCDRPDATTTASTVLAMANDGAAVDGNSLGGATVLRA